MLLDYEEQIFLDCFHDDGLLIMAKGLGIERILLNFLKVYSDQSNLVLVLNTTTQEEEFFIEQLNQQGVQPLPRAVTNEIGVNERRSTYLQGGVLFVTSRILVVDLLTDRLPAELVSGILVFKANKIIESCQEAFILRLYRQKNKTGFIKGFSGTPQAFTTGFCHVERVMKNLFVRKLYIWPRFHASVLSCLEKHQPDVVEIHVPMTASMTSCQTALVHIISACIKELKQCNPSLDMEEITTENALTKAFDRTVRHQLDPVWHQLGPKTKQLVSDLRTLRLILRYLFQYDCVTFHNLVNSIRTSERTFGHNSGWMFLDAADSLFAHAKARVICPAQSKKKKTTATSTVASETTYETVLEECPKWSALSNVMAEIKEQDEITSEELGHGRVLLVAEDDRTCNQLREYLCEGGRGLLNRLYERSVGLQAANSNSKQEGKKEPKNKGKGKTSKNEPSTLTLTQMVKDMEPADECEKKIEAEKTRSSDGYYGVLQSPFTVIHPLHGCTDPTGLTCTLNDVQPRYVIMYDADITFVRQLEIYKATHPGEPLRVYFLIYGSSTEEQRYLTSLRTEKQAFELLIREKATMVIPEEREGRLEEDTNLARGMQPANATVNTRKGGLETKGPSQQKVIVDMREFRSELPSLIHRRGIDIEPVTIEVGDYILTPDICVERKSVSDLIGSLNSGRLYNQCTSMSRYYKKPVLLIEFDPSKPFSLQGKYQLSSDISIQDTTSRLTLLTLHFPKLRILWCQSPYATAELFEELKFGRPQPDAASAMKITTEMESLECEKYNHGPQNMLLKMSGVNSKNVHLIMNKVDNLASLASQSVESLAKILDSEMNGKLLWTFLHRDDKTIPEQPTGSKNMAKKPKGKATFTKRKR